MVMLPQIACIAPKRTGLNTVRGERCAGRLPQAWFDAHRLLFETLQAVLASMLWPTLSAELGLAPSASMFAIAALKTKAPSLVSPCDSVPL